jgi:hypothetical protein
MHSTAELVQRSNQSAHVSTVLFNSLCDLLSVSVPFNLVNMPPQKQMVPKKLGKSEFTYAK